MEEEEETILLFELAGLPNPDLLKQIQGPCYILGLTTESPVLQVGSLVFKGNYEDVFGTALVFEKLPDGELTFCGKGFKKVHSFRVVLKQKDKASHANKDTIND